MDKINVSAKMKVSSVKQATANTPQIYALLYEKS